MRPTITARAAARVEDRNGSPAANGITVTHHHHHQHRHQRGGGLRTDRELTGEPINVWITSSPSIAQRPRHRRKTRDFGMGHHLPHQVGIDGRW